MTKNKLKRFLYKLKIKEKKILDQKLQMLNDQVTKNSFDTVSYMANYYYDNNLMVSEMV